MHPVTKAWINCQVLTLSCQKTRLWSQHPYTDVAWLAFLITFQLCVDMILATVLMLPATSSIYHAPAVDIPKWYTKYGGKHQSCKDSSCVWNRFQTHSFVILYMINILYSRALGWAVIWGFGHSWLSFSFIIFWYYLLHLHLWKVNIVH